MGISGLPLHSFEIIGFLWPIPFIFFLKRLPSKTLPFVGALFTFAFSRYVTQYFWIFQAIEQYGNLPFFKSFSLFGAAVFLIVIPFICSYWALFLLLRSFYPSFEKRASFLWILLFPFCDYFTGYIHDYFPSVGIPGGIFSVNPLFLKLLRGSYSIFGSKGIDFFLIMLQLSIVMLLFFPRRKKIVLSLGITSVFTITIGNYFILLKAPNFDQPGGNMNILINTWSKKLKKNSSDQEAFQDLLFRGKKGVRKEIDLIVWPESAIPGLVEQGDWLERAKKELLEPHQALLLGSDRKEFGKERFSYFNAAYLLSGKSFRYQIYKKRYLVPFTERMPFFTKKMGLQLIKNRNWEYEAGKKKSLRFGSVNLAVGICYEEYLDRWYLEQEYDAQLYIFLNREFDFSPLGKKVLLRAAHAKALQTLKPVLRATNGGISAAFGEKERLVGTVSDYGRKYKISPLTDVSLFYRFGYYLLPITLFFAMTSLLFHEVYRREKG